MLFFDGAVEIRGSREEAGDTHVIVTYGNIVQLTPPQKWVTFAMGKAEPAVAFVMALSNGTAFVISHENAGVIGDYFAELVRRIGGRK